MVPFEAGGGKSYSLLLDCLKYIDCPYFYGVYFRQTMKQIERSLWPLAKEGTGAAIAVAIAASPALVLIL